MRGISSCVRMGIRGGNNGTDVQRRGSCSQCVQMDVDSQNHTEGMGLEKPGQTTLEVIYSPQSTGRSLKLIALPSKLEARWALLVHPCKVLETLCEK